MLDIKNIINNKGAALAPLAGVSDSAMRRLCREYKASYTVSEMISAKALVMGDKKTESLAVFRECERPYGVQLFGSEPEVFAAAAAIVCRRFAPDFIDINMGCPAPKITRDGAGCALMRDPQLCARITAAAVNSADVPVSIKMRSGWECVNAPRVAALCAAAGAAAVTVHARTYAGMFSAPVDFGVIAAVKSAVDIPVVGNGGVCDGATAKAMFARSGCDGIMVGRAAMGTPFVFAEIFAALHGEDYTAPPLRQKLAALRRQVCDAVSLKGEHTAMLQARKQAIWYLRGARGAAALRRSAGEIGTLAELDALIERALSLDEQ